MKHYLPLNSSWLSTSWRTIRSKYPQLNHHRSKESKVHKECNCCTDFLALKQRKITLKWIVSKRPRHGVCKWASAGSMAKMPQAQHAKSCIAAQALSCLPALWSERKEAYRIKNLPRQSFQAVLKATHSVEEALCCSGQSRIWCIPHRRQSWSCRGRGVACFIHHMTLRKLINLSQAQNSLLQQNNPTSPLTEAQSTLHHHANHHVFFWYKGGHFLSHPEWKIDCFYSESNGTPDKKNWMYLYNLLWDLALHSYKNFDLKFHLSFLVSWNVTLTGNLKTWKLK